MNCFDEQFMMNHWWMFINVHEHSSTFISSHRGGPGDYLTILANSKLVKFPKYSPNLLQTFHKFPKLFSSNVIHARKTFYRSFVNVQNLRDYSVILTFGPKFQNIRCFPQIFTKLWQTIRLVRQMYVSCSPLLTKLSPETENGEQAHVLWTFGDSFAKILRKFGERVAKWSPNNRHLRHLYTKRLVNNL